MTSVFLGHDRACRGKDLFKVGRPDELLHHGDVRAVRLVESKTLREGFEQTAFASFAC